MIEVLVPESIKVGGFDYEIRHDAATTADLTGRGLWGFYVGNMRRVDIRGNAPSQQFSNSLLHEMIHAIDDVYFNDSLEERQVEVLTNGLHQVLEQLGVRFVPRGV